MAVASSLFTGPSKVATTTAPTTTPMASLFGSLGKSAGAAASPYTAPAPAPGTGSQADAYNAAQGPVAPTNPMNTAPIAAGNGTYGNMGTNLVTPAQGVPGVTSGGAYDPSADRSSFSSAGTPAYGTQSGPGVLEQWFGERAGGTDPGYEYATKRGLTSLDNAAAARGGFNGGASMQQDSDYLANLGAQREGQLDTLAAGASGERQNNLNSMLGLGMGLAGGQSGLGAAYDVGGANAMSGANNTGLSLGAQGIGLQYGANQNTMNQLMGLGTLAALA